MKQTVYFLLLLLELTEAKAQDSTNNSVQLHVFADNYYQYDFNKPADKLRPAFLYNYKRTDRPNINLAFIKAGYANKNFRANIGLMTGDYSTYNLATEPPIARHILEANIGYTFSSKLSVEAGVLPSHLGFESAIAKDNWNPSRSLLAENSPYYETGIKLNYTPTTTWSFSVLLLNGWQNIKETNKNKAAGTQVQFKPSEKWVFNSSTFIGNEKPDTAKQLRLFHNFYASYSPGSKTNLVLMLDIGAEKNNQENNYAVWKAAALLLQHSISAKIKFTGRLEYYSDKTGVIVSPVNNYAFETAGLAFGWDYSPVKNIIVRSEFRSFNSRYNLFLKDANKVKTNTAVLFCLLLSFNKNWKW